MLTFARSILPAETCMQLAVSRTCVFLGSVGAQTTKNCIGLKERWLSGWLWKRRYLREGILESSLPKKHGHRKEMPDVRVLRQKEWYANAVRSLLSAADLRMIG